MTSGSRHRKTQFKIQIRRTNVPDVRVRYRHETLDAELALITTEIMNSVNTADNTTTKNTTTNATC